MSTNLSSKEKLAGRLFKANEIKEADRADLILMNLLDGRVKLSPQDTQYKEYIFKCYDLLCSNYRQVVVMKLLRELIPSFCDASLRKLIIDTQKIISKTTKRNLIFDLSIQRERLLKYIEKLTEEITTMVDKEVVDNEGNKTIEKVPKVIWQPDNKDFAVVEKMEKQLFELDIKLSELTNTITEKKNDLPSITFSADPELLKQAYSENLFQDGDEEE